ncbi:MAG: NUDIX hydrolase [Planctomycetota bacterium]
MDAPGPSTVGRASAHDEGEALRALDAIDGADARSLGPEALRHRAAIRAFLAARGAIALTRASLDGHLTASCLLWSAARDAVLLHHHKKLDLWLQFGGHCDGEGDLGAVALRETIEESGIEPTWISPAPVDFDVHGIPARPGEPAHDHLDVRYLAVAPPGAAFVTSDESHALAWVPPDEVEARGADASLLRLLGLGPPADPSAGPR